MRQDPAEPRLPNIALSDVLMAVDPGTERRFGIVRVDDLDIAEAHHPLRLPQGVLQAVRGVDFETRRQQVAGVEAISDAKIAQFTDQIADGTQFLEPRA